MVPFYASDKINENCPTASKCYNNRKPYSIRWLVMFIKYLGIHYRYYNIIALCFSIEQTRVINHKNIFLVAIGFTVLV